MRPELKVIRGGLVRGVAEPAPPSGPPTCSAPEPPTRGRRRPVDISPTERWRPTFPVSRDWPQHLEDAAAAADRCGQPVILAPQVVRELAFLLRLGPVA